MARTINDLADYLYSGSRAEDGSAAEPGRTTTAFGVAAADSADGSVPVVLSDDVTQPEDGEEYGTAVVLPTSVSVREGDEVIVTLVGGTMATPYVSAVVGEGDRQDEEIGAASQAATAAQEAAEAAARIAGQAQEIAEATGQHFWHDESGAHISTDAQDPAGAQNSLWNSAGMLFRRAASNLLAILAGTTAATRGVAVYDGAGNASSNIVATFTGAGSRIGKSSGKHISIDSDSIDFSDGEADIARIYDSASASGIEWPAQVDIGGSRSGGSIVASKAEPYLWIKPNGGLSVGGTKPSSGGVRINDGDITALGMISANARVSGVGLTSLGSQVFLVSPNLDEDGGPAGSQINGSAPIYFRDKTMKNIAVVDCIRRTGNSNTDALRFLKIRRHDGSSVYNGFHLGIDIEGKPVTWFIGRASRNAFNNGLREVLYDNATGTTGTVTLSASAANFDHLTIYYRNNGNVCGSVDVYQPNGKLVNLYIGGTGNDTGYAYPQGRDVSISGTSITTRATNRYYEATITGSGASSAKQNRIAITRVEGW